QVTAKTAFLFILPQYNVSVPTAALTWKSFEPWRSDPCFGLFPPGELVQYHYGLKDLVTILFYIFIAIILHAVVQEYALDKINRRLHLSKVKHSKFNESGQLVAFHLTSVIWCLYVVVTEGYISNPRSLWENYPHVYLPYQVKFFYLCQLAYWLHALPELYFQKVRKEEIPRQLRCIALYLLHIAGAYLLNYNVQACLGEMLAGFPCCTCKCIYMDVVQEKAFSLLLGHVLLPKGETVAGGTASATWGDLGHQPQCLRGEGWAGGGLAAVFSACLFSAPGRMSVLLLVCLFQASVMWRFIHFQLRRWREYWNEQSSRKRAAAAAGTKQQTKLLKRDSGECWKVVKAENGTSPRTKKLKSP
ncbi:TRAM2 protein, partial [Chloropsis hardwickii]|nr:TRAM2 protein [Chloropsis hardwickii]